MNLEEIKKTCEKIIKEQAVAFSDYHEERKNGEVRFVNLTLKWLVEEGRQDSRKKENG